jgi:hypothetical protein
VVMLDDNDDRNIKASSYDHCAPKHWDGTPPFAAPEPAPKNVAVALGSTGESPHYIAVEARRIRGSLSH